MQAGPGHEKSGLTLALPADSVSPPVHTAACSVGPWQLSKQALSKGALECLVVNPAGGRSQPEMHIQQHCPM